MEEQIKIIYRNYGIADSYPDGTIELNKHLDKYPNLKKSLIQHEVSHTKDEKFTRKDFMHDMTTMNQIKMMEMVKFMTRHPLSLVQFAPIYWTKKRGWIIDINLLIGWGVLSAVVLAGLFIGGVF